MVIKQREGWIRQAEFTVEKCWDSYIAYLEEYGGKAGEKEEIKGWMVFYELKGRSLMREFLAAFRVKPVLLAKPRNRTMISRREMK